ncbi:MAG: bifunctional phosphopantothenoylcysteine decarboxylase/phosphopantothenate--cysteine ligase CoaBC [Gemmatimonadetes bacterium]|nr:bifunctional phosphopantothenoylcysteine decarboxylase/phosphopantothenate--cysteine ligase CoaBC [Gemmatimonadota bacterium]NIQ60004.1 bifunctional phosphopantothenoylcysteine decarboxylase/phosphopantothenate--cysteine ligase CoaBC [Gemmatimonadota bacterium]NIU80221.1 bifunctional phosphopantothenoylcysteine decarboxylase/phosphopantothenate--cysteine ligase CoaBC [Gammaproteobacteria bacterium]NIX48608.1 bifunctional phosphopantothenoylcysteine decarboxylase/phosphopantothenate--cysteine 
MRSPQPGAAEARRPWSGRRVLLGVTGGIAAYKVVQVARDLTQLGAEVDVVMTRSARAFVGEVSFEGVTGRPVTSEILEPGHALDHIRLARSADVVCVAPATADFLARAAHGRSDDLLGAVLLATRAPVLVCPAMNDAMWSHPATRANAERLSELGYTLVGPAEGPLAYGEGAGPGRMTEASAIVEHVGRALEGPTRFSGRTVVVTAGPTREAVDPVRFLSNRSSGRMGFAVAAAAWRRGAAVELIAGPTGLAAPVGARMHRVETADEMRAAVASVIGRADALVMAAAIADFRPRDAATSKIKKSAAPSALPLEPAPDVLMETASERPPDCVVVGFALETDDAEANARQKLESKGLDLVVLNEAGPDTGFETETNRVTLIDRDGESEPLPLLGKDQVADHILDRIEKRLPRLDA